MRMRHDRLCKNIRIDLLFQNSPIEVIIPSALSSGVAANSIVGPVVAVDGPSGMSRGSKRYGGIKSKAY
jgi:hypothetical protein